MLPPILPSRPPPYPQRPWRQLARALPAAPAPAPSPSPAMVPEPAQDCARTPPDRQQRVPWPAQAKPALKAPALRRSWGVRRVFRVQRVHARVLRVRALSLAVRRAEARTRTAAAARPRRPFSRRPAGRPARRDPRARRCSWRHRSAHQPVEPSAPPSRPPRCCPSARGAPPRAGRQLALTRAREAPPGVPWELRRRVARRVALWWAAACAGRRDGRPHQLLRRKGLHRP